MTTFSRVSAIIPAAGMSTRMKQFKPLLPLGHSTLLEAAIQLFKINGILDIRVVTGHRSQDLEPLILAGGAVHVHNPDFCQGMLSSIRSGIRTLSSETDAFFVLPADIPAIRPWTVKTILNRWPGNNESIVYPFYDGLRGHPPLIGTCFSKTILEWNKDGGLRGCLLEFDSQAIDVQVCDNGIHMDADTQEDYACVRQQFTRREIPSAHECRRLMTDIFNVPRAVVDHGEMVGQVALTIYTALKHGVPDLDADLILASALLHDIARQIPDHAAKGARRLRDYGFFPVADCVETHMDINPGPDDAVNENEILFLADKVVQGIQTLLDYQERFEDRILQFKGKPDAVSAIRRRLESALIIQKKIETLSGRPLKAILGFEG